VNAGPPSYVIEAARKAALESSCAKSKRGVALFNRRDVDRLPQLGQLTGLTPVTEAIRQRAEHAAIAAIGFNGQPPPFMCSGSDLCRRDCGKLCLHAEERAIRAAGALDAVDLELVHVEVVDGQVVSGSGPSCWQCSRLVVEVKIRGVWLYESLGDCPSETCPMCTGEECRLCGATGIRAVASSRNPEQPMDRVPVLVGGCNHNAVERHQGYEPSWKFYSAEKFHAETLRNEEVGDQR